MSLLSGGFVSPPRNRCIIPFIFDSGSTSLSDGVSYYPPIGGFARAGLPATTEANAQLTLAGYAMTVREMHYVGNSALTTVALRDDAASVVTLSTISADTEKSSVGLAVAVAANSKLNLLVVPNGTATVRGGGFLVAEVGA